MAERSGVWSSERWIEARNQEHGDKIDIYGDPSLFPSCSRGLDFRRLVKYFHVSLASTLTSFFKLLPFRTDGKKLTMRTTHVPDLRKN